MLHPLITIRIAAAAQALRLQDAFVLISILAFQVEQVDRECWRDSADLFLRPPSLSLQKLRRRWRGGEIRKRSSLQLGRMLYFFTFATLGAIVPFLSLILTNSGIAPSRIGLLGALTPLSSSLGAPLGAAFADRSGRHEQVMLACHLLSVAARTSVIFTLLPRGRALAPLLLPAAVAAAALLAAPVFSIIDALVFKMVKDAEDADVGGAAKGRDGGGGWGRLRLFGSLGFGVGCYTTGRVADFVPALGLRAAFGCQAAFAAVAAAVMASLLDERRCRDAKSAAAVAALSSPAASRAAASTTAAAPPAAPAAASKGSSASSDPVVEVLKACLTQRPLALALWPAILACGACYGFLETFLFPRLSKLGFPSSALGSVRLANALSALPAYFFSQRIIRAVGVAGTVTLSLAAYAARLATHAGRQNKGGGGAAQFTLLAVECLYGISGAMWSAAAAFTQALAPPGLGATAMGVLSAVHFGAGMTLGSVVGGWLLETYSATPAVAFRVAAAAAAAGAAAMLVGLVATLLVRKTAAYEVGGGSGNGSGVSDLLLLGEVPLRAREALRQQCNGPPKPAT